jgi:hypothetical protein
VSCIERQETYQPWGKVPYELAYWLVRGLETKLTKEVSLDVTTREASSKTSLTVVVGHSMAISTRPSNIGSTRLTAIVRAVAKGFAEGPIRKSGLIGKL